MSIKVPQYFYSSILGRLKQDCLPRTVAVSKRQREGMAEGLTLMKGEMVTKKSDRSHVIDTYKGI